jgi:hypothetical protein
MTVGGQLHAPASLPPTRYNCIHGRSAPRVQIQRLQCAAVLSGESGDWCVGVSVCGVLGAVWAGE